MRFLQPYVLWVGCSKPWFGMAQSAQELLCAKERLWRLKFLPEEIFAGNWAQRFRGCGRMRGTELKNCIRELEVKKCGLR